MDEGLECAGVIVAVERGDGLAGNGQEFLGESVEVGILEQVVVADDADSMTASGVAASVDGRPDSPHRLVVEGFGIVAKVVVLPELAERAR